VEPLLSELHETAVVSDDVKLNALKIAAPLFQHQQDGHILFFVCG